MQSNILDGNLQACQISEWEIQPMAMLLKALIFLDRHKFDEAIEHLRDALIFHSNNFDFYEVLVKAYTKQNKIQKVSYVFLHHLC